MTEQHTPEESERPDVSADESVEGAREPGIEWHPDALRPAFDWRVQLPTDWAFLDTHPARWKRQNERIVDDYFGGRRVSAKVRKELVRALTDAVAAAQQKKVLLTLIKPGISADGRIENIVLNLAFTSSAPRLASMAPIRRAFDAGEAFEERTTPTGNAYGLTVLRRRQRDGTEVREVVAVQAFYPFAATPWTLAVNVTSPQTDLEPQLRDLVIRCVASVRWEPGETAPADNVGEGPVPAFGDALDLVDYTIKP